MNSLTFASTDRKTKKRECKSGAGTEKTHNKCDTAGFPLRDTPGIKVDNRGSKKLLMPRNHSRLNQSSEDMLRTWRGNCDVQVLIYESSPDDPSLEEIANVTDYVVAYQCKGNCTLKQEREQNKNLILQ